MKAPSYAVFAVSFLFSAVLAQDTNFPSNDTASFVDDNRTLQTIITECGLSGVAADKIAKFENGRVVSLDLSNRDISKDGIKAVPAAVGDLAALQVLVAKNNDIRTFPVEVIKLRNLRKLDLASNKISVIPPGVGELETIEIIDLRYNGIEELPPEIAKLKNLIQLQLWGNKLAELQPAVTLLPALKELYLKDNRLTTLPEGIIRMKSLTYIDIIGNKICEPNARMDAWLKTFDKRYRQVQKCW